MFSCRALQLIDYAFLLADVVVCKYARSFTTFNVKRDVKSTISANVNNSSVWRDDARTYTYE